MTSPADSGACPPPEAGTEVWLVDLPLGPLESVVTDRRDDEARLSAPRVGGREVPLPPGTAMVLTYRRHDVPCEVAAVVDRPAPGGPWVRFTGPPVRLQRRQAVRVPVQLIVMAEPGSDEVETLSGITENLSATGAMVRLDRTLTEGSSAGLRIECGGAAGSIHVRGRVVRSEEVRAGRSRARPFRVAFAFAEIDRPAEDRLVHFLFQRQRELRHREVERGRTGG